MDIKSYSSQTKELAVTLKGGEVLKLTYKPNYMTGNTLKEMDKFRAKAEESFSFVDMHKIYVVQLVPCLHDIDLTLDGEKIPFGSDKEKEAALSYLSYQDLLLIDTKIREDIAAPLAATGTDSSSGHLQKVD